MPLEFTEYPLPPMTYGALPDFEHGPEIVTQSVEIGATAADSEPFDARTRMIFVSAVSAPCRIAIGPAAVAANGEAPTRLLNQDHEYRFRVEPGWLLSVIEAEANED